MARARRKKPVSLNDAVRRFVQFVTFKRPRGKVAVFVVDGGLVLADTAKLKFEAMLGRYPDAFVGAYDRRFDVEALIADLKEFL